MNLQSYEKYWHKLFKHTVFVGRKAFFLPSCHSTNELAAELIRKVEQVNGLVIYTDYQSKGKGQRGNTWESEHGKNILVSMVLEAGFVEPTEFFNLTIITSLAIQELLSEYLKDGVKIKWPNDLMYDNKKIGGILIENYIRNNVIEWCIAGVGLNVNQENFMENRAISLANICGQQFDREELTGLLLQKVEAKYFQLKRGGVKQLWKDYHAKLYWKGEIHVFQSGSKFFNGRIIGVGPTGKLKIELDEGERFFDFKELVFVR